MRYTQSAAIRALLGAVSLGAVITSMPAQAQESTEGAGVNDIVVTALRRDTSLQETPISISAMSGDTLTRLGATSMNDYFRQVPNLQVEGNSPANRRITIRGVRSAGEATVGLYYDETPLTGPGGTTADAGSTNPDMNLFDVERVEVLRGPQGTLFGSGSMGGTIRMLFNKPNPTKLEGTVEAQGTLTKNGDPGYYVKGMINLPIAQDVLALRVVGYQETRGGFIDIPNLDRTNVNESRSFGGRVMLGFTPVEEFSVQMSANYQKNKLDGQNTYNTYLGAYNGDYQALAKSEDELQLYNITMSLDLPINATFTASGTHYNWDLLRNQDYTYLLNNQKGNQTACRNWQNMEMGQSIGATGTCSTTQLGQFNSYVDSRLPGLLYQPMNLQAWIFEGRLSGSIADDLLTYTVGVFHDSRKDRVDSQVARADSNGTIVKPLDLGAWRLVETEVKQTAFYGEVSLEPIDGLTLTAGARRFSYDKTVSGEVLISNYITQSYVGPFTSVDASSKGWVSKFNVSYEFNRDLMAYVTASKGYRPGGANNIPGLGTTLVSYRPDSLWNYEVGVKSQWFDRMLTLNGALYQIDWKDMQVNGRSANGAFSFLTNAGEARIRGAELEMTLTPMRGLNFNSTLGYVDAKLTEDQVNSGLSATNSTGLKGNRIPNIPQFTMALGAEYRWDLSDSLNAMVRADFTHSAGSYSEFRPTYVFYERNSAYQNLGLRAGVDTDNGITVQVFVQNLLNEKDPILLSSSGFSVDQALSLQPRTFGIMARKSF